MDLSNDNETCSPCHTRSGIVYESMEKKKHRLRRSLCSRTPLTLRNASNNQFEESSSSDFSLSSSPDSSDDVFEIKNSRFSQAKKSLVKSLRCESRDRVSDVSMQSPSPPTNAVNAMRLFDCKSSSSVSSTSSLPRNKLQKSSRNLFENGLQRRKSAPVYLSQDSRRKSKTANLNPFTPSAMKASLNKSKRKSSVSSWESDEYLSDMSEDDDGPSPAKRVRVSDINISRYQQEFLELEEIASGEFGTVKKARHCLDGMIYAIKVTKNPIKDNSRDEKVAMNEIFAHAALIKHKNIVRYYNSWAEDGKLYIQNEFCQGGSLAKKIEEARENKRFFTETELKQMTANISKGLEKIHSKQLVHLDIKPDNIFISSNKKRSCKLDNGDESSDSGVSLSCEEELNTSGIQYKIGDLGHVVPVHGGEISPEEGDCRYMAPEFLQMDMDKSLLSKADIFSLGLSLYEAASLKHLPKNSLDDVNYESIKNGDIPYLTRYSREFNNLLRSMVNPEPMCRPSAANILAGTFLSTGINKSSDQLYHELTETRQKLQVLEQMLLSKAYAG